MYYPCVYILHAVTCIKSTVVREKHFPHHYHIIKSEHDTHNAWNICWGVLSADLLQCCPQHLMPETRISEAESEWPRHVSLQEYAGEQWTGNQEK